MEAFESDSSLLCELERLLAEKRNIERRIIEIEAQIRENQMKCNTISSSFVLPSYKENTIYSNGLSSQAIQRYSRQLLLPFFGVQGVIDLLVNYGHCNATNPKCFTIVDFASSGHLWAWLGGIFKSSHTDCFLKGGPTNAILNRGPTDDVLPWQVLLLKSSVLVVGAGGLGSPALLYLTSCGVGHIGIIDHDIVELNNMHRQIIHTEEYIGKLKVESAVSACQAINSSVKVTKYNEALNTPNAIEILKKYDIVIDATDNAPSRYMINDCCVILGKPLVSGAALGVEGQLTVYNYKGGPCYRCLFPIPPPEMECQRCSDGGVLGVVPGVMGCLQALEAIKIATGVGQPLSQRMLIFDALSTSFKTIRIRGRTSQCEACGESSNFSNKFNNFDYDLFTQSSLTARPTPLNLVRRSNRMSCREYKKRADEGETHVLIDVRPKHHFDIISLPNSINIPLSTLESDGSSVLEKETDGCDNMYVICRRGNDSQKAVILLHRLGFSSAKDIVGGLESWATEIDSGIPIY